MKKLLINTLFAILSIGCFGQMKYEKGYFIDNQDRMTECYLKNSDWLKNPTGFKYKLSEKGEVKSADIVAVREFCVPGSFKFVRANVNIDLSPSVLRNLSDSKNPIWQQKQLFLKTLVEGRASLYYFYANGIDERFFYANNDSGIHQLIYKEYIKDIDHTAFNDTFRLQLHNHVRCSFAADLALADLAYKKSDLVNYFIDYNKCIDPSYKIPEKKQSKGGFSLALSAGMAYSSLSISHDSRYYIISDFGHRFINSYSAEVEYTLPFNNGKWGVVLCPTYQSNYHSENNNDFSRVTIDFGSVDLAFGIKHYLYLNKNAKLFASFYINSIWNHSINAKIGYKVNTTKDFSYLMMDEVYNTNFIFGGGVEYKRIMAEFRYYSTQNILSRYGSWNSDFEKVSLTIGYRLFMTK